MHPFLHGRDACHRSRENGTIRLHVACTLCAGQLIADLLAFNVPSFEQVIMAKAVHL